MTVLFNRNYGKRFYFSLDCHEDNYTNCLHINFLWLRLEILWSGWCYLDWKKVDGEWQAEDYQIWREEGKYKLSSPCHSRFKTFDSLRDAKSFAENEVYQYWQAKAGY